MSSPVLEVTAELTQQDTLYFLPLGASAQGETEQFKLGVRLIIKHVDPDHDTLTISGIKFSFPGSDTAGKIMGRVPACNTAPNDGRLGRGDTAHWTNGTLISDDDGDGDKEAVGANQIYRTQPAPQFIDIAISCAETEHPFVKRFSLAPDTRGPLLLPFILEDLDDDEYIVTSAKHHFNGSRRGIPLGTQIYAHDISIHGRVDGALSRNRKADPATNADARVFGRPIRGMAAGVVTNVTLGEKRKGFFEQHGGGIVPRRGGVSRDTGTQLESSFVEYKDNPFGGERTDEHYGSISVTVDYGDIIVKYSHLRHESVCVDEGDHIWPGRKIAEAGNSGNTSGSPHLHMECRTPGGVLCGMVFEDAWMVDHDLVPEFGTPTERVHLDGKGICSKTAALRPFATDFSPSRPKVSVAELDALAGQVFGGVSKGGDGFVIVGSKLRRVPPRGIRGSLIAALVEHDEIAGLPLARQKAKRKALAAKLQQLSSDLRA